MTNKITVLQEGVLHELGRIKRLLIEAHKQEKLYVYVDGGYLSCEDTIVYIQKHGDTHPNLTILEGGSELGALELLVGVYYRLCRLATYWPDYVRDANG